MKDNNKYVQVLLRHSISIRLNNKYKLIFKKTMTCKKPVC